MRRRTYLASSLTAASAALAGCSSGGSSAVNVEDPKDLSDAEDVSFGRDVSVGWIDERFVERNSPDHPAVGSEVTFRAMVLSNLQSEEERLQEANDLQWTNFEFAGDRILGPLFEPVSWVLDPAKELTESFYEKFELMKLVGVTEDDQRFYDRYGYTPFVWATAADADFHPSGTVVDVTATIEYADQEDNAFAPGTADGVYVDVRDATAVESYRNLTDETSVGERASFAGLQYVDQPTLTTHLTDVDYEYDYNLPAPEGGSLVAQKGTVTDASFEVRNLVRQNSASLRTDDQQVVVGATRSGDWSGSSGTTTETTTEDGDSDDATTVNTVAVMDVSGSMDEHDTKSGQTRLGVAKESARSLVNYIESGNRLGLVAFSTDVETVVPLQMVDSSRQELLNGIDELAPRNGTSIGGGLQEAYESLKSADGKKSIVLLSDGQENEPPSVAEVLPKLKSLGVTVYTIGMGSGADRALLQHIADETGGSAAFAPNPSEIRSLYQQFSVSAQGRSTLTSTKTVLSAGESVEDTATVDGSCKDVQVSLSHEGGDVALDVEGPDGEPVSEGGDVSHRSGSTNEVWTVKDPDTGDWTYRVRADDVSSPNEATVEVSADSPVDAELFVSDDVYEETGMAKIELKATEGRRRYEGADVTLTARKVSGGGATTAAYRTTETYRTTDAYATTTEYWTETTEQEAAEFDTTETAASDESSLDSPIEISLRDDGGGPDPVKDDGLYTGYFHPPESGEYAFEAVFSGGAYGNLSRDLTESLSVDQEVDEPVRPYEPDSGSLLADPVERYGGPAAVLVTMIAVLIGVLRALGEDG